jgi:hypothetical protein
MKCPYCGGEEVDVPMVDIGVGSIQCGPAMCYTCNSVQDENGQWIKHPDAEEVK